MALLSCWPKLEQNILTTCKSLQAKQTPPKPRQILNSVPTSGCWATSWPNWPCHGFCYSSCQDLNSDFTCCSLGSDPRSVFTAWRVEAPILCSVWFYKWFYATWIWVKQGETGYDIQRCLRHNAKQGCRLILADRLQGRCCGKGLSFPRKIWGWSPKDNQLSLLGNCYCNCRKNMWCACTPNPTCNKPWQKLKQIIYLSILYTDLISWLKSRLTGGKLVRPNMTLAAACDNF